MASKFDEALKNIPDLKIKLEDIIDFNGKCLDPMAIQIISESLDYALQTSVRRLESVAKINPSIRDKANEILPVVKGIITLIRSAPPCNVSALSTAPTKTPRPPPIKREPPVIAAKKKTEPKKPEKPVVESIIEPLVNATMAKEKKAPKPRARSGAFASTSGENQPRGKLPYEFADDEFIEAQNPTIKAALFALQKSDPDTVAAWIDATRKGATEIVGQKVVIPEKKK